MDDFRTPIEGRARFGRPYLRIAAVIAFAVALLGVGYFGPHTSSPRATPMPSVPARPTPKPVTTPTLAPVVTQTPPEADVAGLTRFEPPAGQIAVTWLPGQVTSESMALIGTRLYFIVSGSRIESTEIGANAPYVPEVTVPNCQGINQLAAAGTQLIYVVTSPGGPSSQVSRCGRQGSVAWSVWILDLRNGSRRQVASGVRQARDIGTVHFPIHVAISASAYAFDRPASSTDPNTGETVEVHALNGSLLWASRTDRPVAGVMLGGDTLAVLSDAITTKASIYVLATSTASRPELSAADRPAISASLSADGSAVVWEVAYTGQTPGDHGPTRIALASLPGGWESDLTTLTGNPFPEPLNPEVWSVRGRRLVTWFTTAPGGAVYPAIRDVAGGNGVFLPAFQEPLWVGISDNTLAWVSESPDGWSGVVLSVDLSALDLG